MSDIKVSLTVKGYELIGNGTIVINDGMDVEFHIQDLKCTFQFISDVSKKNTIIESIQSDNKMELTLKFFNYDNALGTYNTDLLELGNIGDKKLYLNYRIYGSNSGSTQKVISYSWFLMKNEEGTNDK